MTSLVTGASGFVGSHVVDELLRRGQSVRALVRHESQAAELRQRGVEAVVGDVRNPEQVATAVRGTSVVHHGAALISQGGHSHQDVYDVNLGGVRHVLDALRNAGTGKAGTARMILLSSINVLGTRNFEQGAEDLPVRREGEPHADVKVDAEELAATYARDSGVNVVVLRPGLIYGPGERNIPKLLNTLRRGKFAFIGSRDNVVPMVHVSDLVQAMLLSAERPEAAGRTYHITDGGRTTIGQLVDHLAELAGCPKPHKVLPYLVPRLGCTVFELLGRVGLWRKPAPISRVSLRFVGTSRFVDIRRARQELGYAPRVDWRDGLAQYFRWIEQFSDAGQHR